MEQRVIVKNQEQCIFRIQESNLDFYLIIPNNKKVSIVLNLIQNINDEFVKSISNYSEKAQVIPIVDSHILTRLKENQEDSFQYINQLLSNLINTTYQILTFNHIEVAPIVLFNNTSEYSEFSRWFLQKHQGRVTEVQLSLIPASTQTPSPVATIASPVVDQLSNNQELSPNNQLEEEILPIKEKNKEPGFVSYVLLGVVVAVISLVFLYLLI